MISGGSVTDGVGVGFVTNTGTWKCYQSLLTSAGPPPSGPRPGRTTWRSQSDRLDRWNKVVVEGRVGFAHAPFEAGSQTPAASDRTSRPARPTRDFRPAIFLL